MLRKWKKLKKNIHLKNNKAEVKCQRKSGKKEKREKKFVLFYTTQFGLHFSRAVTNDDLMKNCKKGLKAEGLEFELNRLARYCFGDSRRVVFHPFRSFPYIEHKGKNINIEATGIVFNYTSADFWFILFILEFLSSDENGYIFPDVDYIIQHSEIISIDNEIPIYEMPAEILIGRCGIWE